MSAADVAVPAEGEPPSAAGGEPAAPDAPLALRVDHVDAAYGPYRALFDVSFTVPAGGVVALLGSNGAGKSTVARVITGLVPCTEGSLHVAGCDVTGQPAYKIARAGVAHVPEGRGVFASLTVEENLTLAFRQRAGRRAVAASLACAYDAFPVLGERCKQRGGTLSGGQQRLLSLAKVLVVPPALLVADELSLGLAPVVIDAVYDGLREINRAGTALLVVEQQVDRALDLARSAVVLEHGSVAFTGPASKALAAVEKVLAARGDQAASATCSAGHPVAPGTRFCTICGASVDSPVPTSAVPLLSATALAQPLPSKGPSPTPKAARGQPTGGAAFRPLPDDGPPTLLDSQDAPAPVPASAVPPATAPPRRRRWHIGRNRDSQVSKDDSNDRGEEQP